MKLILRDYFIKLRSVRATVHKMMVSVDSSMIDTEILYRAEDFLDMYKTFTEKIVGGDTDSQVYNGNVNRDVFKGSHGNTVVGLLDLKTFGNTVASDIAKCVKSKAK